ncbi:MAG TPA: proline racemase family protein [Polyangiaceae bacterium]|nr:proline racemase family protein [Polyangiaceae bacterium]
MDSHTEGEPTRVVCEGGPDLGGGSLADRRARFASDHDRYRSAIVNEPRGSDIMVGALLCEPVDRTCATGVIFFNDVGYLGMCGHGIMGLVVTLAWLGRISTGEHRIETPVGVVSAKLHANGRVSVANVSSYRYAHAVSVDVPGLGRMTGDVAWGGNWFFLASDHAQELSQGNVTTLTDVSRRIREALRTSGVRGEGGADIDHIELLGPPSISGAHSKNFVLCPGAAFDRSPCGTGTSAKLACLYVDGALAPGDVWQQESITGTLFEGRFVIDEKRPGWILPSITGTAHVTAEAALILADADPLQWGIRKPWEKTS